MAKSTVAARNSKDNAAARAEREWRAKNPEAAMVPAPEIRSTRAERLALRRLQIEHGNESAKRKAEAALMRERSDTRERERLRNARKRPHKHLPAGLVELPFTVSDTKDGQIVTAADEGDSGAKLAIGVRRHDERRNFEHVSPELARDAEALRSVFQVESYDAERVFSGGPRPMVVPPEVADAIREATRVLQRAWVTFALEAVTDAIVERESKARGAVDMVESGAPRPPTTPEDVHAAIAYQMRRLGQRLPDHVSVNVVRWMLSTLAVGVERGGGRSGKMGASRMREVLSDPEKLVRATARRRR
jgi:hypothetical protein